MLCRTLGCRRYIRILNVAASSTPFGDLIEQLERNSHNPQGVDLSLVGDRLCGRTWGAGYSWKSAHSMKRERQK